MKRLLEERVAVITGASGDIGEALAMELSRAGARVVLHCHRNRARAEATAERLRQDGAEALVFQGPLAQAEDAAALMNAAQERFRALDVLVNNVGMSKDAFLLLQPEEEWRSVLEVNLVATALCCKEAVRLMLRSHRGSIVNVSSLSGLTGLPGQTAYSASKAGVIGLTKALAQELGSKGIRVNALAPGLIDTEWVKGMPQSRLNLDKVALGRLGRPEEVAQAALFLASDLASYITGAVLNVSGGLYTGP